MSASEPAINLGNSFELDEDGDDAILRHVPSGAEFRYNASAGEWQITDDLDADGNDITNVGSFSTEKSVTDARTEQITVPTDYGTVASAISHLETLRFSPGLEYEVLIESGHEIQEPIQILSKNLSNAKITSEDTTVPVSSSFPDDNVMKLRDGAVAPLLELHIDCQSNSNGLDIKSRSVAIWGSNSSPRGIINSTGRNANVSQASILFCYDGVFTGAASDGVRARAGSIADLGGAPGGNISGNGGDNLVVTLGSQVRCINADLTGASNDAIRVGDASILSARNCDVSNAGRQGVFATEQSSVDVANLTANNVTSNGILAAEGGTVNANDAAIDGAGNRGISANGGEIAANGGEITNSSVEDIRVRFGGIARIDSVITTSTTGGGPHQNDLNVTANQVNGEGIILAETVET